MALLPAGAGLGRTTDPLRPPEFDRHRHSNIELVSSTSNIPLLLLLLMVHYYYYCNSTVLLL